MLSPFTATLPLLSHRLLASCFSSLPAPPTQGAVAAVTALLEAALKDEWTEQHMTLLQHSLLAPSLPPEAHKPLLHSALSLERAASRSGANAGGTPSLPAVLIEQAQHILSSSQPALRRVRQTVHHQNLLLRDKLLAEPQSQGSSQNPATMAAEQALKGLQKLLESGQEASAAPGKPPSASSLPLHHTLEKEAALFDCGMLVDYALVPQYRGPSALPRSELQNPAALSHLQLPAIFQHSCFLGLKGLVLELDGPSHFSSNAVVETGSKQLSGKTGSGSPTARMNPLTFDSTDSTSIKTGSTSSSAFAGRRPSTGPGSVPLDLAAPSQPQPLLLWRVPDLLSAGYDAFTISQQKLLWHWGYVTLRLPYASAVRLSRLQRGIGVDEGAAGRADAAAGAGRLAGARARALPGKAVGEDLLLKSLRRAAEEACSEWAREQLLLQQVQRQRSKELV